MGYLEPYKVYAMNILRISTLSRTLITELRFLWNRPKAEPI